jgi:ribonuclease HI
MLELMNQGMDHAAFLDSLLAVCLAQQRQDAARAVHWSRHLLACIARVTGAKGLIGCRAVTYHPHYWWFSSPEDEALGSLRMWPVDVCVLLLDAYPPEDRNAVLRRAFGHGNQVWILRLAEPGKASTRDLQSLADLRAQLFARLPKQSLVLHARECWSEGQYDARPSQHATEIWRLGQADPRRALVSPAAFLHALGNWEDRREDFHWPEDEHPMAWDYYCESQQDAVQREWDGIVAAIDGSVDRKTETMGAGFVVGTGQQPEDSLSFPVGGPLASLRGEAAGLDCLLDRVEPGKSLLVFTDCLVLLTILLRWGRVDFWPDPDDVRHFDIISSCLNKLRRRTGPTRLVKVKSHSGLLMNDRADALAEQGRLSEEPPRWPGARKLEPLRLVVRQSVRELHPTLPDDNVPDKRLIRRAVEQVELTAACRKGTTFSREMLQDPVSCGPVLAAIGSMPDSTVRLWMQAATGQYPTTARLHKMFPLKYPSATCPWCQLRVPETLGHFLTMCPRFREARTEAHNRCWRAIMRTLAGALSTGWQVYIDKPMSDTGLLGPLGEPPNALPARDGALDDAQGERPPLNLLRLRPDAVAVNRALKKVAILEHCRPYDSVDRDRPSPPLDSPAPLGTETEAGDEDDAEMGTSSRADGTTVGERAESETHHDQDLGEGVPLPDEQAPSFTGGRQSIRAAYERKKTKYQDLAQAIGDRPCDPGWRVQVLPWVVGVRGVLDAAGIQQAMAFLELPAPKRKEILRTSATASVEALVYMHRVRKSGASRGSIRELDAGQEDLAEGRRPKRRRGGESAGQCLDRWKRLRTDAPRVHPQ